MNTIINSIHTHPTYWALGSYYLFSNIVSSLPTPQSTNSFYRWFFDFSHGLAGNISRIVATRYPQASQVSGKDTP
jgi:hypothetical protein